MPCDFAVSLTRHEGYSPSPSFRAQPVTCFDQQYFSQYVANRGIKCVVLARLAFLHFCHHYKKSKPQTACKLQEDEIVMEETCLNQPTDLQHKGELRCQLRLRSMKITLLSH